MHKWIRHGLVVLTLLLSLWLVWGFWQVETVTGSVLTAMLILLAGLALMHGQQSFGQRVESAAHRLPPEGFRGTLVLVCGSSLLMEHRQQEKSACWYLCVDTAQAMLHTVAELAAQRPELLGNLAFLFPVLPGQSTDRDSLQEQAFAWRRAVAHSRRYLSDQPEIWFAVYLEDWLPVATRQQSGMSSLWFASRAGQALQVWQGTHSKGTFEQWLAGTPETRYDLTLQLHLEHALQWWQQHGLPLWQSKQAGTPALSPNAVAWHFLPLVPTAGNLWHLYLDSHTGLQTTSADTAGNMHLPFPKVLCDRGRRSNSLSQPEKSLLTTALVCTGFFALAMLASFKHNQRLLQHTQADLAHFRHLGNTPLEPKLVARQQLRDSAEKLLRWEREGIPSSYGLGLYQGGHILPRLQAALGEWAPPVPPVQVVEQVLTLDSLALFDTGQAALKQRASKVLIDALVNIKAKPGWLIVVTGHTDSTGSATSNQLLSERRAEAVRDWMLSVSDLSANCFAVQGLGDTRPVADNNTEEGRGKNRRVEIRLYPQADACQDANINSTSLFAQDDVVSLQMEK